MLFEDKILEWKKSKNYSDKSAEWFVNNIRKPNADFFKLADSGLTQNGNIPLHFRYGSLYYMKYDITKEQLMTKKSNFLTNKSSNLEQYVPMMLIDWMPNLGYKDKNDVILGLNLNFMPLSEREKLFYNMTNNTRVNKVLEFNEKQPTWLEESPIPDIDKKTMDKIIFPFNYAIRPYNVNLIGDMYGVSTKNLEKFSTINFRIIPEIGMDDVGAWKILKGKIDEYVKNGEFKVKEFDDYFKELNKRLNKQ